MEEAKEKFAYCEGYNLSGYVSRIDRAGQHPFGGPNEVNLDIMNACMLGENVEKAIDAFFEKNYPTASKEVRDSFRIEKSETQKLETENLTDFIVCGGAMESHRLQKEVNFSDTFITEDGLYRIPGSGRGRKWSTVNTHGWFSYELKVKPNEENKIMVLLGTMDESIDIKITIDGTEYTVNEKADGKLEYKITYNATSDKVRIRFDRFTANTPCVYTIKVL